MSNSVNRKQILPKKRLRKWLVAGECPEWQEITTFGPEVKAYYSQRATLTLCEGLLYYNC